MGFVVCNAAQLSSANSVLCSVLIPAAGRLLRQFAVHALERPQIEIGG